MKTNQDLESIFTQAMDLADPHRGRFLDEACGSDTGLRNRVGRLLTANQRAASFMSEPAAILDIPDVEAETNMVSESSMDSIGEQPGDTVGRYKLLERIGEGGMGWVFMAEQTEPVQRKVALKVVKPGLDTKEVIARFESERQALALMDHENIARVLDAGATQQGRPYFVMELVAGVSISDYCNDQKLTSRQRLELFVPVCRAIQHAHQKGIIHRDIKPSNVMVTLVDGKPVPKVIDFGIAKAVDQRLTEKTLSTKFGEFIGTPAYMSPEQATVSGIDVDTRSDVYSLGATLYELLVGVPPFDNEQLKPLDFDQIRRFICEENPRQPSDAVNRLSTVGPARATTIAQARSSTLRELQSQLHGELDWIVMRSLEKERDRRYDTASMFADDVERFLHNEPVVARPSTMAYRWKKFIARNRGAVSAVAAVLATLLVATCVSGWLAYAAIQARNNESRETETLQAHVDFINQGLFAQADPLAEPNRNIKLRTVLDRAAQELANQPIKKPSVEAAIRATIGETYRGLGEYETAQKHLQRSYELCRKEYGESHRKTIGAGNQWANVLLLLARYDDVKTLLADQLAVANRVLQSDDQLLLDVKSLEASRLEAVGEHEKAEKLLRSLLQLQRESFGDEHPETLTAMANLGYVLQSQQRHDEALELLKAAHEGVLRTNDQWHPAALKITANLATLHSARQETQRAEEIFAATLPKLERLLGPEHPQALTAKHSLALLRFSADHPQEAASTLANVLASQQKQLGESHPSALTTMHNLALMRKSLGQFEAAESLLKAELELRQRSQRERGLQGEDQPATRQVLSSLAFLHLDRAQFASAIPYYKQLSKLAKTNRQHAGDSSSIIATMMLGLCYHKSGEHELAKVELEAAREQSEHEMPEHWLSFVVTSLLGEVYQELGERRNAEDALLQAYNGLRAYGDDIPTRWQPMGLRAATRRLAEFYETADSDELRSRAETYREELEAIHARNESIDSNSSFQSGKTGNTQDGNPN